MLRRPKTMKSSMRTRMPSSAFLAAAPAAPPSGVERDGGVSPRSAPWIVGRSMNRPFTDD